MSFIDIYSKLRMHNEMHDANFPKQTKTLDWVKVNKISDICFFFAIVYVKLVSFYFMNSIAVFSVTFSHIFADMINFCCNFRSVTQIFQIECFTFFALHFV